MKSKTPRQSGKIFSYETHFYESPDSDKKGEFDVLHFSSWVNAIALTKEKKMVLVRQFRAGTGELTWELPGGAVDPDEDPEVAVVRELEEETGYRGKDPRSLLAIRPNPAFQSNTCTTYVLENVTPDGIQNLDPLEEIQVEIFSLDEVKGMLRKGEIDHSLIVAALAHYFLFG